MLISQLTAPLLVCIVLAYALYKRVDILSEFCIGALENLKTALDILPTLLLLVTAIAMLSASGVLSAFSQLAAPALDTIGFPPEVLPLALIRPVSGSGAAAMFNDVLSACGADSFAGRTAAVLMGSTETTFYTIAVYYSAVKLKAEPMLFFTSLSADTAGFVFSALIVRLFY